MKSDRKLLLVGALVVAAFLMRSPITGICSLIGSISQEMQLSTSVAGLITTIPLLMFALISPFVGRFNRLLGAGRLMQLAFVLVFVGMLVRSYGGEAGLFAGTLVLGIGIACINVMVPTIARSSLAAHFGMITSVYLTVMAISAGLSAGLSVPLAVTLELGWRHSLAVWALFPLLAVIIWLPLQGLQTGGRISAGASKSVNVYTSAVAWWLASFTALQGFLYYCFVAWLPTILQDRGLTTEIAGYYASAFQMIGIVSSFLAPLIAARWQAQQFLVLTISCVYVAMIALLYCVTNPGLLLLATLGIGFCASGGFSLAMLFIGLRANTSAEAAELSGMAQACGYALAVFGPFVMGSLNDMSGSWSVPVVFLFTVSILLCFVGFQAGKNRKLGEA